MSTNPFSDPYQSPQYVTAPPSATTERPAVITWYIVYCVAMALLYSLCAVLGVVLLAAADKLADGEDSAEAIFVQGVILTVIGGSLLLLYAIAPFLPRRKFAWIYGFVTIGFGLTSLCTLPFCIPLLIFWVKPELKAYLNAN